MSHPCVRHTRSLQENENLRSRVLQLESCLQQRAEQLSRLEHQKEQSEWRRTEETKRREDSVRELQLELDKERNKAPVVKVRIAENVFFRSGLLTSSS